MTSRRSPIIPAVSLALAAWIGTAYVLPAAEMLTRGAQEIEQVTYNETGATTP